MVLLAVFVATATGCFGTFALTRKVYEWNDQVSDNDFVKTLIFYGLNFIPIYSAAGLLDLYIFNVIEYWTGSSPLAMVDGEYEEQIVERDGKMYKMSASKNQISVYELNGEELTFVYTLMYCEEGSTLDVKTDQGQYAIAHVE